MVMTMRSLTKIRARSAALGAALALALPSAPVMAEGLMRRMFFPERASEYARPSDSVSFFIFWTTAFFFVLLMGLMVLFVVKYRRRPGQAAPASPSHNTPLELAWSGIPLVLLGIMFFLGARLFIEMRTPPIDAITIDVTAQKWAWSWEYPGGATSLESTTLADAAAPVFAVPVGRPVRLVMNSTDVIHSLYIPAFRDKVDVMPNRYTTYWFRAEKEGDYHMYCAEYCGDQHSQMMALIKVMNDADYQQWIATQLDTSGIPLVELGRKLYISGGCNACHTLDGRTGTGPTWKGIWGETHVMTTGERVTVDENYIRESILDPNAKIVAGYPAQMPTYQGRFSDRELRAFIAFIASLSEGGEADAERMMQEDGVGPATEEGEPQAAAPIDLF